MGGEEDMNQTNAYEGVYHDERAVYLRAGAYEAVLLTEIGRAHV